MKYLLSMPGTFDKPMYVEKTLLYPSGMILGSNYKAAIKFDSEAEAKNFLESEVKVKMTKSTYKRLNITKE